MADNGENRVVARFGATYKILTTIFVGINVVCWLCYLCFALFDGYTLIGALKLLSDEFISVLLIGLIPTLLIYGIIRGIVQTTIANSELYIYSDKIEGKIKNRSLKLPMEQVSSIFYKENKFWKAYIISLATSSGKVSFGFVLNHDEVIKAVENAIEKNKHNKNTAPTPTAQTNSSAADEILKYKQLLDSGVITQAEFDSKKQQLLNS